MSASYTLPSHCCPLSDFLNEMAVTVAYVHVNAYTFIHSVLGICICNYAANQTVHKYYYNRHGCVAMTLY